MKFPRAFVVCFAVMTPYRTAGIESSVMLVGTWYTHNSVMHGKLPQYQALQDSTQEVSSSQGKEIGRGKEKSQIFRDSRKSSWNWNFETLLKLWQINFEYLNKRWIAIRQRIAVWVQDFFFLLFKKKSIAHVNIFFSERSTFRNSVYIYVNTYLCISSASWFRVKVMLRSITNQYQIPGLKILNMTCI